jgi:hypothetical protein
MKPYTFAISFLVGMLCAVAPLSAQDKEGFVLVRKEGTVALYERWFTVPSSKSTTKVREVKCEFYYHNTAAAGLRLLRDESRAKKWQSYVKEFKVYPLLDTTSWFEYTYHDIPWPVSDQDHFMEYKLSMPGPGQLYRVSFKSKVNDTLAPKREGVTRMQLVGSWTIEQVGPSKVKVIYKIQSRPMGIPKVFTDPIIRSNIITTFQEFIAMLEEG